MYHTSQCLVNKEEPAEERLNAPLVQCRLCMGLDSELLLPDLRSAPDEKHVAIRSKGKAAVVRGFTQVFGVHPLVVGALHLGCLQWGPMRPARALPTSFRDLLYISGFEP